MADAAPSTERRGGAGFGGPRRDGERRGRPMHGKKDQKGKKPGRQEEEKEWVPVTKLGRLVKDNKIADLHDIYYHALPIKEYQIVDKFLSGETLKDEVMKIMPVQKQTAAGQRTKFKAYVVIGDRAGHVGLGTKVAKEVATAIRGAIIDAKLNIIPVRRGYWGNRLGAPHTVPMKVTGKSGSIICRLIPAPRGTGLIAAPTPKKLLQLAGVEDVFANTRGSTKTQGNFVTACYLALAQTCAYLTPDLWRKAPFEMTPYQEFTDFLAATKAK
ncbi:small subunit ribosomal protein S2e [Paratrimastix pyriformis]|uniref:Small ribosomal subunit protein uS5 n=1 Tax=Paratrimastix pyriformis TaxID=342808 RepID=A0ABQ9YN29_9EUKA|nr:small subunit ribosomal protein S2e [Paratrimastix pyriformis]|eukprot:GAFH01003792.1.p2 GENE.GAFH01003792.1~~GAFH01003792.1.p2  ORF type:complete len:278 (+),score=87.79 GAFH01003792.1:23-835(+)